jgi:hypothetical protein
VAPIGHPGSQHFLRLRELRELEDDLPEPPFEEAEDVELVEEPVEIAA